MDSRVGRYTIDHLIALGGMAEVFLARAEGPAGFSKQVVIKRILPQYIEDAAFVRMFLDEAKLAALLNHPNIVQVFDFGEEDGTYYIAMEYIEGESLRDVMRYHKAVGRALDPRMAAYLMVGACEGLHYAHGLCDPNGVSFNVVHRDMSPDNILVSTGGITKVVDFGIAKAEVNHHRTQTGVLRGKYGYMSPELIRGRGIDRRVDVYALGVTLYELVTSHRPFRATNELELLQLILETRALPAKKANPEVPSELSAIIDRAMAPDTDTRFQDTRALQNALEDFLTRGTPRINATDAARMVKDVRMSRKENGGRLPSSASGLPQISTRPEGAGRSLTDPSRGPESRPPMTPPAPLRAADIETGLAPATVSVKTDPDSRRGDPTSRPGQPALSPEAITAPGGPPSKLLPLSIVVGMGLVAAAVYFALAPPRTSRADVTPLPVAPAPLVRAPDAPVPVPVAPTPPPRVAPDPPPVPTAVVAAVDPVRPPQATLADPVKAAPPAPRAPKTERPRPPEPPAVPSGPGLITLRSAPWCDVFLDGAKLGTTPLAKQEVASGTHKLLLRNDATGARRELVVQVKPGEELKEAVVFAMGRVAVRVQPWARVSLDGTPVGTTPMEPLEVAAGPHELEFSNPELGRSEKRRVVVKEGVQELVKVFWE